MFCGLPHTKQLSSAFSQRIFHARENTGHTPALKKKHPNIPDRRKAPGSSEALCPHSVSVVLLSEDAGLQSGGRAQTLADRGLSGIYVYSADSSDECVPCIPYVHVCDLRISPRSDRGTNGCRLPLWAWWSARRTVPCPVFLKIQTI